MKTETEPPQKAASAIDSTGLVGIGAIDIKHNLCNWLISGCMTMVACNVAVIHDDITGIVYLSGLMSGIWGTWGVYIWYLRQLQKEMPTN